MRQLTDSTGAVTFAQAYALYGSVTTTSGSGATSYGFTNEYQSQGKIYLRARHYMPSIGRFLTRDTWDGDANRPMSFNKWGYTEGNPINRVDPTGNFPIMVCYGTNCGNNDFGTDILTTTLSTILSQFTLMHLNIDCNLPHPPPPFGGGSTGGPDSVVGGLGPRGSTLYKVYQKMWGMRTAWWWRDYGSDGNFTLVDFIATIYVRELAGLDGSFLNKYVEAMGRHSYSWCKDNTKFPKSFTCDSTTNRGMLYFIASWSEVARDIADQCVNGCDLFENFKKENFEQSIPWALKVAKGIKNPLPSWKIFDKNAPWDAANEHPNVIKGYKVDEMHNKYQHWALHEYDNFYITTYCETFFLRDDMSTFTNESCILLPNKK